MRLEQVRNREWDLEELAQTASQVLPDMVGRQTRYKVTETPDLRTLRYYITQGLLDPPHYVAGRALYVRRHLLQIIAIKKLQSECLPIRKIREILPGLDDAGLEDLVGDRPVRPAAGGLGSGLLRSILSRRKGRSPASWSRHEIAPGLELHVRNDFPIPESKVVAAFEDLARRLQGGSA